MNKDVTNSNYTMIILLGGINMENKEINNTVENMLRIEIEKMNKEVSL